MDKDVEVSEETAAATDERPPAKARARHCPLNFPIHTSERPSFDQSVCCQVSIGLKPFRIEAGCQKFGSDSSRA